MSVSIRLTQKCSLQVKRVEHLGGDSVAGVASIDRGDALQIG